MKKVVVVIILVLWIFVGFAYVYHVGYEAGSRDTHIKHNKQRFDQNQKRNKKFHFHDEIFKRKLKKYNVIVRLSEMAVSIVLFTDQ